MATKKKTSTSALDPTLTIAQLTERYIKNLEEVGKSLGTAFSYKMEMRLAEAELGSETLVSALTADDIERFNKCKRVMKLKSGKSKAEPSYMKSRRVLRLALAWAAQSGLIAASPIAAKNEPETPEPPAAPEPKKTRKGSRAITHERTPVESPAEPAPVAEPAA